LIIKSPAFLEEKFSVARKNGSDESNPYLRDCFVVSLLTMTEGERNYRISFNNALIEELELTIFTYKWGKCVKSVGK